MDEARWNYEVALKQLKVVDDHGNILGNKLATVEPETGRVIGLVSPKYKLIQNKTLYDVMTNVGTDMGLKLNTIHVCRNRALTSFEYGFIKEEVAVESSRKDDVVKLGISVINSFDGGLPSSSIRFTANALVCLNGMVLPRTVGRISFRDLEIDERSVSRVLKDRTPPVLAQAKIWNQWAKFEPSRIKVGEFISKKLAPKVSEELLKRYDAGADKSLWTLYNIVTYYATHELKTRNPENTRMSQLDFGTIENAFYKADLK